MFSLKVERRVALGVVLVCLAVAAADLPRWATVLLASVGGAAAMFLAVVTGLVVADRPAGLAPARRGALTTDGGA